MDDIAENMNWDLMDKCEDLFDKYKIKPLLGVIPNNQDNSFKTFKKNNFFWDKVRSWEKKGWEISMHGYTHVYDQKTRKKDYFKYGGGSEFYGHIYEIQKERIQNGLQKFIQEKITVRSFFAPNHTYDLNTFKALKSSGIENIIDGYGLIPYSDKGIRFIPQLFYREILLPFGIQSTQMHINEWKMEDFIKFEKFIQENKGKLISFDEALSKVNNGLTGKFINFLVEISLKFLRLIK